MAKQDDLFKKLNKQTPLIKQDGLDDSMLTRPAQQGLVQKPVTVKKAAGKSTSAKGTPKGTPTHRQPAKRTSPAPGKGHGLPADTGASYDLTPKRREGRAYRHELKFYINRSEYAMLKSLVSAALLTDRHAQNGGYVVRSMYFDDRENNAFWDKFAGIREREKYRIRIYDYRDDFVRLERKVKRGEYVAKDTLKLTRDDVDAIIDGDYAFLMDINSKLAHEFYAKLKNDGMRPVSIVDYYREPFTYPVEDVRVTFDLDLRSGAFDCTDLFDPDLVLVPIYESGLSVMEVKFNRFLPEFVRGIINNSSSAVRSSVSKYIMCRAYD